MDCPYHQIQWLKESNEWNHFVSEYRTWGNKEKLWCNKIVAVLHNSWLRVKSCLMRCVIDSTTTINSLWVSTTFNRDLSNLNCWLRSIDHLPIDQNVANPLILTCSRFNCRTHMGACSPTYTALAAGRAYTGLKLKPVRYNCRPEILNQSFAEEADLSVMQLKFASFNCKPDSEHSSQTVSWRVLTSWIFILAFDCRKSILNCQYSPTCTMHIVVVFCLQKLMVFCEAEFSFRLWRSVVISL